ncbi:MAG: thiamine pyrophosphate-dependent dehydrogenase E1 component subunit alpha [Desulfurococcaceae archaeon]
MAISMRMEVVHVDTAFPHEYGVLGITREVLKDMLETMALIRAFEEKVEELFLREGVLMGPSHLYLGMEAIAAGVRPFMRNGDYVFSHHRGHGHAIMLGIELERLFAELLGFKEGVAKGLGGSMHLPIEPERGGLYASAIVGSQIPIAVGAAYVQKLRGSGNLTIVFFGDGAVNTAAFAEGLSMATYLRVPLVLFCENNMYSEFTRLTELYDEDYVVQRFVGYGIPVLVVNGNDPLSVYKALKLREEELRKGNGPIAVVANTYRMKGHGVYDKSPYKPSGEEEWWRKQRDPIELFTTRLIKEGTLSEGEVDKVLRIARARIAEAYERARNGSPLKFEELANLL